MVSDVGHGLMTEEEIKTRIILPYLADLGFDPAEVSLERTFSVRLRRNTHQLSSEKDGYAVSGRLDLLCRRANKNLFIIEVKRDGLTITQDDIDQGISYARLVDNIAPFVIVSNGEQTVVVDTITRGRPDGWRESALFNDNARLSLSRIAAGAILCLCSLIISI